MARTADQLTNEEVLKLQQLDNLADSAAGEYVAKEGGVFVNKAGGGSGDFKADGSVPMTGGITNSTSVNPLTTKAESWVGPSSTAGVYFKGGNVGIGTTNPGQLLEVASAGNVFIQTNSTNNGISGVRFLRNPTGYDTEFRNESGVMYIGTSADNFSTVQNRMALDYNGNIGLGGSITGGGDVNFPGANLVIKSGNIGIGITNPTYKLTVVGNASISKTSSVAENLLTVSQTVDTITSGSVYALSLLNTYTPPADSTVSIRGLAGYITVNPTVGKSYNATGYGNLYGAFNSSTGSASTLYGGYFYTRNNSSGTINEAYGVAGVVDTITAADSTPGTITSAYGGSFKVQSNANGGNIANAYGVYLPNASVANGGTITNEYALFIDTPTRGTTKNYSIYSSGGTNYFGGYVGIGTNPLVRLHVAGTSASDIIRADNGLDFNPVNSPTGTMTLTPSAGAGLGIGTYYYWVTFYTATGETNIAAQSTATTTGGNQQIIVSDIPVSTDYRTVGRKIYRGKVGEQYHARLLTTIADNTTATYTDSTADTSLPTTNNYYQANTTTKYITVDGVRAMVVDNNLTTLGNDAGRTITTGGRSTFIGSSAGAHVTSASDNTFIGHSSGSSITTGGTNVAMGTYSLLLNTTGSNNVSVGAYSGFNSTGSSNTFLGETAGYTTTGGLRNVFLGYQAGYYETGNDKLFIDNAQRTNEADARAKALIYGIFDAATANQRLTFNSTVGINKPATSLIGIDLLNIAGGQGLRIEQPASTDIGFSTFVTSDSFVRFSFLGDGKMEWGSGALVADTNLYRSAANTLKTDDNFVANNIAAGATVSGSNTGDQDLSSLAPKANPEFTGEAKITGAKVAANYPYQLETQDTTAYNGTLPGGGIGFSAKYNSAASQAVIATIQGVKENATDGNTAGALHFRTRVNGGDPTTAMIINSSQLVIPQLAGPEGFLINGKIVPSVASNNLTVAIKGMDGNDPSATNPVYVRIGGVVRSITAALTGTWNAGTNYLNLGSAELATKETDLFVYLGWNASGAALVVSRIPNANLYGDFYYSSQTNEKSPLSVISGAGVGDQVVNIGRFAATLSAGAGYTWSVPTFTASNLIQRPIYETRWLSWLPAFTGGTSQPTTIRFALYKISGDSISTISRIDGFTSNATTMSISFPMSGAASLSYNAYLTSNGRGYDNGVAIVTGVFEVGTGNVFNTYKDSTGTGWTASGAKMLDPTITYPI